MVIHGARPSGEGIRVNKSQLPKSGKKSRADAHTAASLAGLRHVVPEKLSKGKGKGRRRGLFG